MRRIGLFFAAACAVFTCAGGGALASEGASAGVDFDREVGPILAGKCYACHGPDKAKGGLRLDRGDVVGRGGDSGKVAVLAGRPEASELIRRVTTNDDADRMPPKGEGLTAQQVEVLRRWVAAGARYEVHWAYRPIVRSDPPRVRDGQWARNEIDRFVLAKLEAGGIAPSPVAERRVLIKRLYYDLIGLPPSVAEVDAFAADGSDGAYERLVDRLLASDHFGERWGRHWLDLARYADSDGYEKDTARPDAWRYRDWVIRAINADLPFDQFTVEQLAGDLLPGATYEQRLATAFHRQTLTNKEGGIDPEQFRVEATFDRAETTGTVWLGLTVGCARCHTHKYDTITQTEYYQLFAFFNDADEVEAAPPGEEKAVGKGVAKNAVRVMGGHRGGRVTHVMSRGDFLRPEAEVRPGVLGAVGLDVRATDVGIGFPPQVAGHMTGGPRGEQASSPSGAGSAKDVGPRLTRLDLARWIVDPRNPLTARVAVNHVWAKLFGKGLVRTTNDFGVRGERPSHPELLDWLASEFQRLGWSRKRLIKTIVTSAAYRQSSVHRPELAEIDAENRLLARQNRFRVEGEIVRDVTLAAAGLLSWKVGGPSVFPPMPADVAALSYANNFKWVTSTGEDRYRRGMYTFFKRTAPHPSLTTFDCPDASATSTERPVSNTPLQALVMLNSESFHEAAQGLAGRILREGPSDEAGRVAYGFEVCTGRRPSAAEAGEIGRVLKVAREWYGGREAEAVKVVGRHAAGGMAPAEGAAWVAAARVMLNLDEVVTRE